MVPSIKPVIGITSSIVSHNNIPSYNLHEKHIQSVMRAGGVPIIIPTGPEPMAEVWVSICNGIILSSGEDIDPNSFGANPSPKIQNTNKKRDLTEIELVKYAQKHRKPILGLCRGVTMLNVALGGTVIQDIETSNPNPINHNQQAARPEPTHYIQIDETSRLYQILSSSNIQVNSIHHQAIDQLAPNLKKVAVAPDGVIEAVEAIDKTSPMIIGVQWHPEEMASEDPSMQKLFDTFIMACKN
ncbi:gamma-glutamyl-gamma-aminobutyrate hydrolase family protein [Gracilibacillus salitolerans]|uniref:Gamma-glutamyl-gamma-aminobutyrate hydrolase family protein n=1 Tax=Gracilibacillus salitolerans TaxID=2663022 RepID=A0A5Q2THQ7_9BACI|nr:gamma-glutamyl-gamma-aminobutyrate hydrolase family protein [Gracilibacillus salitolerans]QGH33681.1 gamma-glutamyl-gamma-aminobutyrate hydrolase family protein [Gracilibacillus salitolerans]